MKCPGVRVTGNTPQPRTIESREILNIVPVFMKLKQKNKYFYLTLQI